MRHMSFALTKPQIQDRSKTVTRRLGWLLLRPGDLVQAVEKCQGLKKGEKVRPLAVIRIVGVSLERLGVLTSDDVYGRRETGLEGFSELTPAAFVAMFCRTHKGCTPETEVTRIEFEYVDEDQG